MFFTLPLYPDGIRFWSLDIGYYLVFGDCNLVIIFYRGFRTTSF